MPPRGLVVALHGIQSHSGWYEYSSRRICQAGFDLRFMDRRGSGLNSTARGHASHQDRLINDVVQFANSVRHECEPLHPRLPVILLAVSWGGKLAAAVCARFPQLFDAVALLYPGIHARVRPTWYQSRLLDLAECLGVADRLVEIPLSDPALFTADPLRQKFIRDDDLALHQVTTSFLLAGRSLDALAAQMPVRWSRPTLVMLAGRDRIIDNTASRVFFNRFVAAAPEVIEYADAQHTLEFEPNREQILDDLIDWLAVQCNPTSDCAPER